MKITLDMQNMMQQAMLREFKINITPEECEIIANAVCNRIPKKDSSSLRALFDENQTMNDTLKEYLESRMMEFARDNQNRIDQNLSKKDITNIKNRIENDYLENAMLKFARDNQNLSKKDIKGQNVDTVKGVMLQKFEYPITKQEALSILQHNNDGKLLKKEDLDEYLGSTKGIPNTPEGSTAKAIISFNKWLNDELDKDFQSSYSSRIEGNLQSLNNTTKNGKEFNTRLNDDDLDKNLKKKIKNHDGRRSAHNEQTLQTT